MAIRVLSVFGTRPEAIKMMPLVKALEKDARFESEVCITAQHRHMLDQVLNTFEITPRWDLDIMKQRQSLPYITSAVLEKLPPVLEEYAPDILLVHGDTTTTFAAALAAFYQKIPVGHVEAGLRSFDKYLPYPEELNRVLTADVAALHFAPTAANEENLLREGVREGIYVTGNTIVDALGYTVRENYTFEDETLRALDFTDGRYILLTAHRRENVGEGIGNICRAARELLRTHPDVHIVFPVHQNPAVVETVQAILGDAPRAHLIAPVSAVDLHNLLHRCALVLTDSGGIQEEAPSFSLPVLVLRSTTERPEIIALGRGKLVGTDEAVILREASKLLDEPAAYSAMAGGSPYGDGHACERILDAIAHWKGLGAAPVSFVSQA